MARRRATASKAEAAPKTWVDERGHERGLCTICGVECSTHPDAGYSLEFCGDCGRVVCPEHRTEDAAARCDRCAAGMGSNG